MPLIDAHPNHTDERPVPYEVIREVKASETEESSTWTAEDSAGIAEGFFIFVDESGPPSDVYRLLQAQADREGEFDTPIPFEPDGGMRARFVAEAPDFELEWDF
jgi:hypothetical protein